MPAKSKMYLLSGPLRKYVETFICQFLNFLLVSTQKTKHSLEEAIKEEGIVVLKTYLMGIEHRDRLSK